MRLVIESNSREMWALEYEVDELQLKFSDSIGKMDLDNLDVDFIEDMMLKAKPLQTVLNCIRDRQIVRFEIFSTKKYQTQNIFRPSWRRLRRLTVKLSRILKP